MSNAALSESEKIAIVNLDAGIDKDNQKVYYANKIIEYPSDNYQTASLEEAKSGIENGHFAAYVIIPSTFSESVNSINGTPKQAVFEYKISESLSTDTKEKMIYELNNFEQSINSNVSYIYIDAILEEVHNLQDNASTIMKNDNNDADALQSVSADSLVASIKFEEMTDDNNPIEMVNLDKESTNMQKSVDSVQNNYDSALKSGQDEFTKIESNSKSVSDALNNVKTEIDAFDPLLDLEGKSYTALGISSLESEVTASNADISTKRQQLNDSIAAQINEYVTEEQPKIDTRQTEIQESISTAVVSDLQKSVDTYLTDSNSKIKSSIDEQTTTVESSISDYSSGLQEYLNMQMYSDSAKAIIKTIAEKYAEEAFQTAVQMRDEYVENQTEIEAAKKYNEKLEELNERIVQIQSAVEELEMAIKVLNGTADEEIPAESSNPESSVEPVNTEGPTESSEPESSDEPANTKVPEQSESPESSEETNTVAQLEGVEEVPASSVVPSQPESSEDTADNPEESEETQSSSQEPSETEVDPISNVTEKFGFLKESLEEFNQIEEAEVPEKIDEPDIHVLVDINSIDTSSFSSLVNLAQATDGTGNAIIQPTVEMKVDDLQYTLLSSDITYKVPEFKLPSVTTINTEKLKAIEKFYELSSTRFTSVIQKNLTDLAETRNTVLKEDAKTKMQDFETSQQAYQKSLDDFDPYSFVDSTEIDSEISNISTSLSDITTKMNETSGTYMDYVSDVISNANDNTGKLQENMSKANDQTAKNVTSQMNQLKTVRTNNNQINISILKGFAGKLSFTRVGDLPHREAYQFIINPITYQNVNNTDS